MDLNTHRNKFIFLLNKVKDRGSGKLCKDDSVPEYFFFHYMPLYLRIFGVLHFLYRHFNYTSFLLFYL